MSALDRVVTNADDTCPVSISVSTLLSLFGYPENLAAV